MKRGMKPIRRFVYKSHTNKNIGNLAWHSLRRLTDVQADIETQARKQNHDVAAAGARVWNGVWNRYETGYETDSHITLQESHE